MHALRTTVACIACNIVALGHAVAQQALRPERVVAGRVIESSQGPRARLRFKAPFRYAGGQRFVLQQTAEAEQHFFVDADSAGAIRRMYWVQFERRLPGSTGTYHYSSPDTLVIGGLEFVADTKVFADYGDTVLRRDSLEDSDQARAGWLLRRNGFSPPAGAVRTRMFHLPDTTGRSELMIIYIEAVSAADARGRTLPVESPASEQWADLVARSVQDLREGLVIER